MKVKTAYRNLDDHGRKRAPDIIAQETRKIEERLTHFRPELVMLESTITQARGKSRVHASLRLQLPSGVVVAQEEGFELEPVLRKAFADLDKRLERHLARLRHDYVWKRPARRVRLDALLPPARDQAEADRRALYFDLIEDHLDKVYNQVRRELAYLEASGAVPRKRFTVQSLIDATILKGLERFEDRPTEFSVADWLKQLAYETIQDEARKARRAVPEDAATLERAPEEPAQEPTESDQEMFEFYQPDEVVLLEDLVADDAAEDPEAALERREIALAVQRAMADLPALWRNALISVTVDEMSPEDAARVLGIDEGQLNAIVEAARDFLRQRLSEAGHDDEKVVQVIAAMATIMIQIPQPLDDRDRIVDALSGARAAEDA